MSDTISAFSSCRPATTQEDLRSFASSIPGLKILGMHSVGPCSRYSTSLDHEAWSKSIVAEADKSKLRQAETIIEAEGRALRIVFQWEARHNEYGKPEIQIFWAVVSELNEEEYPSALNLTVYCRVSTSEGVSHYYGPGNGVALKKDWVFTMPETAMHRSEMNPKETVTDNLSHFVMELIRTSFGHVRDEDPSMPDFARIFDVKGALCGAASEAMKDLRGLVWNSTVKSSSGDTLPA